MAKLTKDELLERVKNFLGEDTSDDALALIEDITDSVEVDTEDWKTKYEENDKEWRQKYKDRFFSKEVDDKDEVEEEEEKRSFSDLFKEN